MRDFQFPSRSTVIASNGMAATSHPRASLAAIETLRSGGNAVDAAVSAAAVLAVVEPHMTSLGGDCFAIVGAPDGAIHCLNGSGRSAASLDVEKVRAECGPRIDNENIHAVTVPGAVAAWERLLSDHGRFGLDRALAAAIDCAENGTPVAPRIAYDWAKHAPKLIHEGAATHYLAKGHAPAAGDVMAYPALARTLRTVADKGAEGFYSGWVADDLLATLQAEGSALTADDFASVSADPVTPIKRSAGGVDVLGFPPSTQGFALLVILGVMRAFGPWSGDPLDPKRLHVFLEATRRAYAMRNRHLADPDAMEMTAEALTSDETVARIAATIDPDRMAPFDAVADLTGSHTVYLSVVDGDGRACSFINSLFDSFGSKRAGPQSGVLLQNRGSGFVLEPGHPNVLAPGKRPLHTLIPGMVLQDGLPLYSYGVMGGAYQAAGHAYVLQNMLDYGMDPQTALDLPRVFLNDVFSPAGTAVEIETRIPTTAADALSAMGHAVTHADGAIGGGQVIRIDRDRGVLIAGSDPRKDGQALGY